MTGRSNVRVCKVTDCLSVVTSRGWCEKHYRRWRRTGTVADPERGPSVCTVSGCSLPVDARALCHGHYQRRQRTGSVQANIPSGGAASQRSALWRDVVETPTVTACAVLMCGGYRSTARSNRKALPKS